MQSGLGTLRLSPSEFWRSTPREIASAFGSPPRLEDAQVLRQKLFEMQERWPDHE